MRKIINSKGMSLVEVMVVLTIMSMIGLGTATMMKNMFSIQKRVDTKSNILQLQNNLETLLKNDDAWGASVTAAANAAKLGCLTDSVATTCADGFTASDWQVFDNTGALFFRADQATRGFTIDGAPCNTFNRVAGDDTCPLRYDLTWTALCPGTTDPCQKPQVVIVGNLVYAPLNLSDPSQRINVADYQININRGERMRYEPFEITYQVTGLVAGPGSGGIPGGACNAGGTIRRPLSTITYDVGNNVTLNTGTSTFTLPAGTFECKITAQGYGANQGFSVEMRDIDNAINYPAGSAYSGPNGTAYAIGTVQLQLTNVGGTRFRLQHRCGVSNSNFDMGIPFDRQGLAGDYSTPTVYTSISCIRSS